MGASITTSHWQIGRLRVGVRWSSRRLKVYLIELFGLDTDVSGLFYGRW